MNALAVLSPLERSYEGARQELEHLVRHPGSSPGQALGSAEVRSMTHSELERELEKRGRELMRTLLQEHPGSSPGQVLEARGPGECAKPVRGADDVERSRVRLQERKLETVFGTVSVERAGYGQEGAQSLHPLDAELNLPDERYSLELRRRVAEEAAKSSFDETLESIGKTTGGHVPKRQLEELVTRAAQDFDAFYERRQGQPVLGQTGAVIVISVDGKGVVMRPQDLREQTAKAAAARKHKMGARLSRGEKKNAKRMATVAAVYTLTPFVRQPQDLVAESDSVRAGPPRPRPEQKRVWASLEKTPELVIEEAFQEACSQDPGQEKNWVALVDGNKVQLRILRRKAADRGVDLTIIVDVIHVIEYLWDAGRVFHPASSPELESFRSATSSGNPAGKCRLCGGGHAPQRHTARSGLQRTG